MQRRGDGLGRIHARSEWSVRHLRGEQAAAIPATLATLEPDQHALTVDIGNLEHRDLSHAQAGAIGDRESRLLLEAGGRVEQSRDLIPA
jgi:hypothetical protein